MSFVLHLVHNRQGFGVRTDDQPPTLSSWDAIFEKPTNQLIKI
jgi:hypothetical protein